MRIPFDWRKKIIANITSKSWVSVPHVSYIYEADVTALIDEFNALNERIIGKHAGVD